VQVKYNANFVPKFNKAPFQLKNDAYCQGLNLYSKRFSADDLIYQNPFCMITYLISDAKSRRVRQIFDGYFNY
jgi:hypothetical protein